ncbi:hypothetical protein [Kitasatospora sp. NPDC089509]|uniref:hypothetical protein n=1 Tax=Kitasatospora sp. NPDC089509 TaxID=3364079 RepID=UPI0038110E39
MKTSTAQSCPYALSPGVAAISSSSTAGPMAISEYWASCATSVESASSSPTR